MRAGYHIYNAGFGVELEGVRMKNFVKMMVVAAAFAPVAAFAEGTAAKSPTADVKAEVKTEMAGGKTAEAKTATTATDKKAAKKAAQKAAQKTGQATTAPAATTTATAPTK